MAQFILQGYCTSWLMDYFESKHGSYNRLSISQCFGYHCMFICIHCRFHVYSVFKYNILCFHVYTLFSCIYSVLCMYFVFMYILCFHVFTLISCIYSVLCIIYSVLCIHSVFMYILCFHVHTLFSCIYSVLCIIYSVFISSVNYTLLSDLKHFKQVILYL